MMMLRGTLLSISGFQSSVGPHQQSCTLARGEMGPTLRMGIRCGSHGLSCPAEGSSMGSGAAVSFAQAGFFLAWFMVRCWSPYPGPGCSCRA